MLVQEQQVQQPKDTAASQISGGVCALEAQGTPVGTIPGRDNACCHICCHVS